MQSSNQNVLIEVYMLLVNTYFASAKSNPNGIFPRETWLTVNSTIKELLKILKTVNTSQIQKQGSKTSEKKEDGGDLDDFMSSNNSQIQPALVNMLDKLDQ